MEECSAFSLSPKALLVEVDIFDGPLFSWTGVESQ